MHRPKAVETTVRVRHQHSVSRWGNSFRKLGKCEGVGSIWLQKEKGELAQSKLMQKWCKIGIQTTAEDIFHRYVDQSQRVLQFDHLPPKKCHCRSIAAPLDVLPPGLGKFRHVLEVDLQKKVIDC